MLGGGDKSDTEFLGHLQIRYYRRFPLCHIQSYHHTAKFRMAGFP